MTRIGVVVAMTGELRSLTRRPMSRGQVVRLSDSVLLSLAGIGREPATRAARELLEAGASALVSWGTALALAPGLIPGELVLPNTLIGIDGERLVLSQPWHARYRQRLTGLVPIDTRPLAEADRVLAGTPQKQALRGYGGAVAADMESAALGRVAERAAVPLLVVRAIADNAEMALPSGVVGAVDATGRLPLDKLISRVLLHPISWPALGRTAAGFHAAHRTLTRVAARAGPARTFEMTTDSRPYASVVT